MKAFLAEVDIPLNLPLLTSRGEVSRRRGWILRLRDEENREGWGEATPLPGFSRDTWQGARKALCRVLGHWEPGAELSREKWTDLLGPVRSPSARFALELALLDLEGRRRGLPVGELIGGVHHSQVPFQGLIGAMAPEAAAEKARGWVGRGFRTLKVKVGTHPKEDLERLRAVRKGVGEGICLRADANGGWTLAEAAQLLSPMVDLDIDLLEQPVQGCLPLAELRGRGVPLAIDEGIRSVSNALQAIRQQVADVMVLKPTLQGGLIGCRSLALMAKKAGWEVLVTSSLDGAIAREGALHLACSLDHHRGAAGLATGDLLAFDLKGGPKGEEDMGVMGGPGVGRDWEGELHWEQVGRQ